MERTGYGKQESGMKTEREQKIGRQNGGRNFERII